MFYLIKTIKFGIRRKLFFLKTLKTHKMTNNYSSAEIVQALSE